MRWFKVIVFLLCLLPFGWLFYLAAGDNLGANPVEELAHETGAWALRFLLITLAMTPLRHLTGWTGWIRIRRMLGLYTFFYAVVHFLVYALLDLRLDLSHLGEDILKRPYITVGFTALLMLLPLALTSTRAAQRRLGRRWKKLHRLVYVIAILGVVHFWWLVKADIREPLIYGAILLSLLLFRLPPVRRLLPGAG